MLKIIVNDKIGVFQIDFIGVAVFKVIGALIINFFVIILIMMVSVLFLPSLGFLLIVVWFWNRFAILIDIQNIIFIFISVSFDSVFIELSNIDFLIYMSIFFRNGFDFGSPLRQILELEVFSFFIFDFDPIRLLNILFPFVDDRFVEMEARNGLKIVLVHRFLLYFAGPLLISIGVHFRCMHFQFVLSFEDHKCFFKTDLFSAYEMWYFEMSF